MCVDWISGLGARGNLLAGGSYSEDKLALSGSMYSEQTHLHQQASPRELGA